MDPRRAGLRWRLRPVLHCGVVLVLVGGLGACAELDRRSVVPPAPGLQSLYRLELRTGADNFSGRLILRERGPNWEVSVADGLGREVWAWRVRGANTAWIDATRDTWCPTWQGHQLAAIPEGFDGEALRRLLHGMLPDSEVVWDQETFEVHRPAGTWSGTAPNGQLSSWRLDRDAALVWSWKGDARRGLLLAGNGFEMEWTRIVVEPLSPTFELAPLSTRGLTRDCSPLEVQ